MIGPAWQVWLVSSKPVGHVSNGVQPQETSQLAARQHTQGLLACGCLQDGPALVLPQPTVHSFGTDRVTCCPSSGTAVPARAQCQ